jgi:hypothetical protein
VLLLLPLPLLQRSQMDAVTVDEQMLVADNMAFDPAFAAQGSAPQQLAADNYALSQEMSLRPASQVGAGSQARRAGGLAASAPPPSSLPSLPTRPHGCSLPARH